MRQCLRQVSGRSEPAGDCPPRAQRRFGAVRISPRPTINCRAARSVERTHLRRSLERCLFGAEREGRIHLPPAVSPLRTGRQILSGDQSILFHADSAAGRRALGSGRTISPLPPWGPAVNPRAAAENPLRGSLREDGEERKWVSGPGCGPLSNCKLRWRTQGGKGDAQSGRDQGRRVVALDSQDAGACRESGLLAGSCRL
jgi:hypothetical protein